MEALDVEIYELEETQEILSKTMGNYPISMAFPFPFRDCHLFQELVLMAAMLEHILRSMEPANF